MTRSPERWVTNSFFRFISLAGNTIPLTMYINFNELPDSARVWVYQADQPLSDGDVARTQQLLQHALSEWAAHGQPLLASAQVIENRFVVIGVDEGYNLPSGCSIDASVRTLRDVGQQVGRGDADAAHRPIDFFDRSVAIRSADGSVQTLALPALKQAVADGLLTPDTPVFNTLSATKAEFLTRWQVRAADSWVNRYFRTLPA